MTKHQSRTHLPSDNEGNEEGDQLTETDNDGPTPEGQWPSKHYHDSDESAQTFETFKREPDTSFDFNSTRFTTVTSMDAYRFPAGAQSQIGNHGLNMDRTLPDRTVQPATGISPLSAVPRSMDQNYGNVSTHYQSQQAEAQRSTGHGNRQSQGQTPALQNGPSAFSPEDSANSGQSREEYYSSTSVHPIQTEDNYQLQASSFDDHALARYNASMAMQQPAINAMPSTMANNEQYQLSQYGWMDPLPYQAPVLMTQPVSNERYYNAGVVQPLQSYLDIKEDEDEIVMPSARAENW